MNFYRYLTKLWNINAPQGCIVCVIFQKFAEFWPRFLMRYCESFVGLAQGLCSYGGFNLTGFGYPQTFQCLLAAKLCVRPPNILNAQERAQDPLSPCQVWWRSDFTRRRGGEKRWFFVCPSCFLSVTLFNVIVCVPDFTMKTLDYKNDFDALG